MGELKEGVYIAQGPETNILIKFVGHSPFIEVVSAIDLNKFYQDGSIRALTNESIEVVDIMSFPEKYRFEVPSLTEAVKSAGMVIDMSKIDENGLSQTEEEIIKCQNKLKEFDSIYSKQKSEIKMKLWLKDKFKYSLSQGEFIIKKLRARGMIK